MYQYTLQELIDRIRNSTTDIIFEWLANIPSIALSETVQVYFYGNDINLILSDYQTSFSLEEFLHPDRFKGDVSPRPVIIKGWKWLGDTIILFPKDTLTFQTYFILNQSLCLSVVTGKQKQLLDILRLSFTK